MTNANKYKIKGLNDGGVMEPSGVFSITALYVFPYSTFLSFAQMAETVNKIVSSPAENKITNKSLKIKNA